MSSGMPDLKRCAEPGCPNTLLAADLNEFCEYHWPHIIRPFWPLP